MLQTVPSTPLSCPLSHFKSRSIKAWLHHTTWTTIDKKYLIFKIDHTHDGYSIQIRMTMITVLSLGVMQAAALSSVRNPKSSHLFLQAEAEAEDTISLDQFLTSTFDTVLSNAFNGFWFSTMFRHTS